MKWLTLPNDLLDNQKVQSLPKKIFKLYINTLCVVSANAQRGLIPTIENYAFKMRLSVKDAQRALETLENYFLVFKDNDRYFVCDWKDYEEHTNGRLSPDIWEKLRLEVFSRDNHTCQYCGATKVVLECDHIVPICKDGSNDINNLATACKLCNRSKGGKLLEEWNP